TVYAEGREIELTDTEYAMLHLLIKYRRQIFSAERLYEAVWDEPYYYGANNTIMVHIRNLRKKIEKDARNPVLIKTIWGKGYRCD
ncbi:winged helix family transcriptional regulator, partial [Romboutsia ilealis]|nr:winged helix family transcriptional regulator [Romboutsia ilealis]